MPVDGHVIQFCSAIEVHTPPSLVCFSCITCIKPAGSCLSSCYLWDQSERSWNSGMKTFILVKVTMNGVYELVSSQWPLCSQVTPTVCYWTASWSAFQVILIFCVVWTYACSFRDLPWSAVYFCRPKPGNNFSFFGFIVPKPVLFIYLFFWWVFG